MTYNPGTPPQPFSWQGGPLQPPAAYVPMQHPAPSPPPVPPRRRRAPAIVSLIVLTAVAIGAYAVVANRQALVDQWVVWNAAPDATIDAYVARAKLSEHGEFLLLASQPRIADGEAFNSICGSQEEGSGVLGCYTPSDMRITLFDVTDPRLDGIEEVVAAHEMLHAAWDRMSVARRAELEVLLEKQYAALEEDQAFVARMEIYARTEPGQRANELHSIIGTEVGDLIPELEEYYAQYFDDRATVVQLHTTSNAVFQEIDAKSTALVAELDALRLGIESDNASASAQQQQLNADIDDFNQRADSGTMTQADFERERAALIARQDAISARFDDVEARIALFDAKSAELEQLNAQAAALNTALNITPRTTETIE